MPPRLTIGLLPGLTALLVLGACRRSESPPVLYSPEPTIADLIQTLRSTDGTFHDVPFAGIIHAATGREVIPLDPGNEGDAEIVAAIRTGLSDVLDEMNRPNSVTNLESRINECSAHFEEAIRRRLNAEPGFTCDFPRTADGAYRRSGYPDLRLVHEATGRVAYLDPKLVEQAPSRPPCAPFITPPPRRPAKCGTTPTTSSSASNTTARPAAGASSAGISSTSAASASDSKPNSRPTTATFTARS